MLYCYGKAPRGYHRMPCIDGVYRTKSIASLFKSIARYNFNNTTLPL